MAVDKRAKRASKKRGGSTKPASTTCTGSVPPNAKLSGDDLPTTVLVARIDELKLLAERVVDVPELYDRICRQLRVFGLLIDVDETPSQVLLENVEGLLYIKGITFQTEEAADRFWDRAREVVRA
jgi:hypothetical protein